MDLWVHNLAYPVTALGPGHRVALWVAGCSLHCRGCITPGLWERQAGVRKDTASVAQRLLAMQTPLDGITITGGEPFEQPAALADLLRVIIDERPHWNVLVYSGYRLAALRRMGPDADALLKQTDVLVAGAYRPDRAPNHPLAGSGNQRIHLLSAQGKGLREQIDALPRNQANLGLSGDGDGQWLIGVMARPVRARINRSIGAYGAAAKIEVIDIDEYQQEDL